VSVPISGGGSAACGSCRKPEAALAKWRIGAAANASAGSFSPSLGADRLEDALSAPSSTAVRFRSPARSCRNAPPRATSLGAPSESWLSLPLALRFARKMAAISQRTPAPARPPLARSWASANRRSSRSSRLSTARRRASGPGARTASSARFGDTAAASWGRLGAWLVVDRPLGGNALSRLGPRVPWPVLLGPDASLC